MRFDPPPSPPPIELDADKAEEDDDEEEEDKDRDKEGVGNADRGGERRRGPDPEDDRARRGMGGREEVDPFGITIGALAATFGPPEAPVAMCEATDPLERLLWC